MRYIKRGVILLIVTSMVVKVVWHYVSYLSGTKEMTEKNTRKSTKMQYRTHLDTEIASNNEIQAPPTLIWWDSMYTSVNELRRCGKKQCFITNNRSLKNHRDTVVFIFYGSYFKPYDLPLPRQQNHYWALLHEESPRNAYILSHRPTLSIFNFTSTYSPDTDYAITTQWLQCPEWINDTQFVLPLVDKNRLRLAGLAPILYLHSDCVVPSDRDSFVRLLQNFIPIDSYGRCVHNKEMPKRLRFYDNMDALNDKEFYQFAARYKFTLAMENYVCDDYITEKLWRPLRLGSVPIYFGAPNVKEYLPSNKSVIVIQDFQDVEDLARFIKLLDNNDDLYTQYLQFKETSLQNRKLAELLEKRDWLPEFCKNRHRQEKQIFTSIFSGFECFLCESVTGNANNKNNKTQTRSKQYESHSLSYTCPSPRQFDGNGNYVIHNDQWSAEWNQGRYEAAVMQNLYKENKVMTQKEFHNFVQMLWKKDTP